jgi:uncharacterized protein (TIGR03083 family)
MARLVTHTGQVHQWAEAIVRTRALDPVDRKTLSPPPEGPAVVDWYREGVEKLATTLEAAGPDAPAWNWTSAPKTAAYWIARQPVETAIHRWDAQRAVGDAAPIDTQLAILGVNEALDLLLPVARSVGPFSRPGATAHLHATDADGEWLLTFTENTVDVQRGHAKGDVALRGPASGLLLFLWKRLPVDAPGFEVFGDASVLNHWVEQVEL